MAFHASVPGKAYNQVSLSKAFPILCWEWAGWAMAGEAGVLASPWLAWKPAQTPSLIHPLQPWDAGWASHCSFSV